MLGPDFNDLRLLYLAQIYERSKILGLAVFAQHISQDAFIAALIFLVSLHDRGMNIEIVRLIGESPNGSHLRKGLKSILRHEAGKLFGVVFRRRLGMPYLPIVHVSVVLIIGNF